MISVVMSIYNGQDYLDNCLASLETQTDSDFELILVDDGSTDNSKYICLKYESIHANTRVISKQNGGLSSARREGMKYVNSDYVVFIDCDDVLSKDYIKELNQTIKKYSPDLIICSYEIVKKNCRKRILLPIEEGFYNNKEIIKINYTYRLLKDNYENFPSFLWLRCLKKELIEENFFVSEKLCFTEDLLFNLLYVNKISNMYILQKNLYYYNVNENSLTNQYRRNLWEMLKFRYGWIKNYCDENNYTIELQKNLSFLLWSSLAISFDNATKINSLIRARNEMKKIRTDDICSSFLLQKFRFKCYSDKVKYFLIKYKCYSLYYFIKRIR